MPTLVHCITITIVIGVLYNTYCVKVKTFLQNQGEIYTIIMSRELAFIHNIQLNMSVIYGIRHKPFYGVIHNFLRLFVQCINSSLSSIALYIDVDGRGDDS